MKTWSVTRYTGVLSLIVSCVCLLVLNSQTFAGNLVVTTTEDELNSDGDCSLREALEAANTDTTVDACGSGSGDDTIGFTPGLGGTITLNGTQLTITSNVTIDGPSTEPLAISGNNASRVLYLDGTFEMMVQISHVTITNGNAGEGDGGGIYNKYSQVSLNHIVISNNTAGNDGGGLYNFRGSVTVNASTVSGNTAYDGGGLYTKSYTDNTGTMDVQQSTISDNTASHDGGGLYADRAMMTVIESTVSANHAGSYGGGGRNLLGTLSLENSTVSGNSSTSGAGIWNQQGTLNVTHCTVSNNIGNSSYNGNGAAIHNNNSATGSLNLINTLVADNLNTGVPYDCRAPEDSLGTDSGNLIESHSYCGTPVSTSDPLLGPLRDNGGPTETHALLAGSPAIDAGDPVSCLTTDQRGTPYERPSPAGEACDIGAYEYQQTGGPQTFMITATAGANGSITPSGAVTVAQWADQGFTMTPDDGYHIEDVVVDGVSVGAVETYTFTNVSADHTIEVLFAANILVVTTTNDSGPGSLRQAILDAPAGYAITFHPTLITYPATITLSSELTIDKNLTITGPGTDELAISGNNVSRIFYIDGTAEMVVTLSGVTIRDGNAGDSPGGGIYNRYSHVTLDDVSISDNTTTANGGGLYSYHGVLTLSDSTVSGNTAYDGGGIYNASYGDPTGTLDVQNSTVSDNTANHNGGGLYTIGGLMTVIESTVSANQAGSVGGGLRNSWGTIILENSTISGNGSTSGSGIWNHAGTLTLRHCTVTENTGNSSYAGVAVYTYKEGTGTLNLSNTIIAGNHNAGTLTDCKADPEALGTDSGNLIESHSYCGTPVSTSDPLLGPLQDNGGSTWTHALLTGSPAIDTGDTASCLTTDQRGISRPQGSGCDIGAYESQSDPTPTPTPDPTPTPTPTPTPDPITITKDGNGSGSVLVNSAVVCDPTCSSTQIDFVEGETYTFEALPEPDSVFDGWKLNGEFVTGIVNVLPGDVVTAIFTPIPAPTAAFSAAPVRGYAPLTVVFTNSSTGDISGYAWAFGDGDTSPESEPTHVYDTVGQYSVSLTASGPGGSDTLMKPEYIAVVPPPNQDPVVTITSPAEDAVVASGDIQIDGTVTDDGTVVSMLVNNIPATVIGDNFSATISVTNGNQLITVVAEDDVGAMGVAERLVRVDGEGPLIGIQSPKRGQAVYTLTPDIAISYRDFYTDVDTASLQVQLVDEQSVTTDVTGDLTITDEGAQGTLSTPLTDDTRYTLTVSLADTLGNVSQSTATFYVPLDPASITPPAETEGDGWVSGVVYDSTTCNEHLQGCTPLPGARVTLTLAGSHFPGTGPGDPVAGTIVTGPEGFFAFPLPQTDIYWLRVEKDGYTYAQREVDVVRQHSTATDEIYLTPLDPAVTLCETTGCTLTSTEGDLQCDATGCIHTNSDGTLQVDIPFDAIPAGQTVEVTSTNFQHVEFLPSGRLPEGTWETYAFNLGGDSEVEFSVPITVKIHNERNFDPGTEIPLGYWNQETLKWEHAGVGTVDAAGDWVEMSVTHFSNYDCNAPIAPLEGVNADTTDQTSGHGTGPCATGEKTCFIDYKSGTFTEDYALPAVPVFGQELAPRLVYSSRRVAPSEVIDIEFSVDPHDPSAVLGNYVGFTVYIEGQKTDEFSFSATLQPGDVSRYRYVWDGRDAQGILLPPGVYEYRVKVGIPYRAQYYYALNRIFGGQPDYVNGATGRFTDATQDIWVRGTIALNTHSDSPLGAGWVLAGQQRLYKDEAGRILISDGERNDEFSHPNTDLLRLARSDRTGLLVWANYGEGDTTIQSLPEALARSWSAGSLEEIVSIDVGDEPYSLTLSADGTFAYVAAKGYDGETMPIVNLQTGVVFDTVTVGFMPVDIALSPDETMAYVAHLGSQELALVDLTQRTQVATIPVHANGASGVALSPDGAVAYVASRYYSDTIAVIDLSTQEVVDTIPVGSQPNAIVLSADGRAAYVTNTNANTLSVLDLDIRQQVAEIPVGNAPYELALSADGTIIYVTNSGENTVSVVDLDTWEVFTTIAVGAQPHGIVVTGDGAVAYVANRGENTISVVDLSTWSEVAEIPTGDEPVGLALTGSADPNLYARTATDRSWLEYDGTSYTRIYPNGTRVHFNADGTHDYMRDRHGNRTDYTYNPDGTTASMTITPDGEATPRWIWTVSYQDGKLTEISDPAGRTTTFSIDGNNHLTAIESPLEGGQGGVRRYTYDSRGLMTHATDELGHSSTHVYDQYGRITQVHHAPTGSGQETLTFSPADMSAPFINDSSVGDPDSPAPAVPTSADLIARVDHERGSLSGHTDKWGRWLDKTDALNRTTTYQRDEAGNLLQRKYPDGSCDEYTYDTNKNLLSKSRMGAAQCALAPENRDPAQVQTTWYTYEDRFNRIKTKTDPQGKTTTYIYDYEESVGNVGNLIRIEYPQVEDETGTVVTPTVHYSYNAWGQVSSETDSAGTVTRYVYTQGTADEASDGATPLFLPGVTPVPGLLTQIIKDDGGINQTTTYTDFDAVGNPGTIIGPDCCGGGQETHYTYDMYGRVLTKEDALGIITTYEYDAAGNLVRKIEDYTADGTTGRNVVTDYSYDANGNLLTERTVAENIISETTRTYDENGKLASTTDANGNTTTYTYDDADQLDSVTDPMNQTTAYTYTEKGFLEITTLPNGTVVRYVYNAFGQKVQEIEDDGGLSLTTSYAYDHNGNLETRTDPEGVVTRYVYDGMNRLISETQDEGGLNLTTTYRYDLNGNVVSTTDPRGVVTLNSYDALGRLRSTRSDAEGLNLETTFDYDDAGNLEHMTDPRSTVTTYEYDDMNRRIATHEDATGLDLITRYTYDRLGNQHFVTDANGVISLTDYNAFGKPVRSVQDVGGIEAETLYVYDDNLNLIAITDDNGNTTQYTYDERNQRREIHYADGTTVGYTYTPLGSVDTRTNQAGEIVDFGYDALERVISKVAPGVTQSFTYSANSRLSTAQQQASGHTTNVSFDYDALGSVQEHVQTVDGLSWTTTYSYDYTGGTATTTYPSGTQVVKSLDTLSRLNQVQQDGALVAGYSYNMTAGTITQSHGNGLSTLVETDPVWRVTRLSSTMADYRYGYDNVDNRTYMQRAHKPGTPTDVYQYDNLYQLRQVWYGADATEPAAITTYEHLQAYTLDPVGNRLEVENDGVSENYLPNDGQKLTNPMHRYEQVNGQVLGYDLKGNLLDDETNTYTYDVLNRQISMIGLDSTAEYVYDALGRRVAKVVDGVTTYFVYNAFYQVLEERDGNNQLLARYTYGDGIDEPLTMERGGNTYTYHSDALGSITEVTDTGGSLVERYEYDVYGAASIFDGSDNPITASAIGNPYLFTARRYDPESGNYYYRARMYSPILGRFLQMDPLGYVDGMNLYAYVGNNPIRNHDPFGYGRNDYHLNSDNSVTFTGEGATIWEAVHLFKEELGYSNWQEAVKQFAQVYPGAETWWDEQGNWTGQPGATLIDKTLPPKKICDPLPPTRKPEPHPPWWDDPWWRRYDEDSNLPGWWKYPEHNGDTSRTPATPCDRALGKDYYWNRFKHLEDLVEKQYERGEKPGQERLEKMRKYNQCYWFIDMKETTGSNPADFMW